MWDFLPTLCCALVAVLQHRRDELGDGGPRERVRATADGRAPGEQPHVVGLLEARDQGGVLELEALAVRLQPVEGDRQAVRAHALAHAGVGNEEGTVGVGRHAREFLGLRCVESALLGRFTCLCCVVRLSRIHEPADGAPDGLVAHVGTLLEQKPHTRSSPSDVRAYGTVTAPPPPCSRKAQPS